MLTMFVTVTLTDNFIRTTSFKIDTKNRFLYFTDNTNIITTITTSFK